VSVIRLAIVDDHRVVSRSLSAYFALFEDIEVAGIAHSGEEFLANLEKWRPAVAVVDLMLPGGMDGIALTARVAGSVRVVALTASIDEHRRVAVLQAGAAGYVRKNSDPEILLAAVRAVAAGRSYIDPEANGVRAAGEDVSPRELEVLRELARGCANKEIAARLHISEETVKTHVSKVLAKLGAENRADAIVQALRRGILVLEELD